MQQLKLGHVTLPAENNNNHTASLKKSGRLPHVQITQQSWCNINEF